MSCKKYIPSTPIDPLDWFIYKLAPLLQSSKFPDDKRTESVHESIEMTCIAAKHGSEWILVSGKAALKLWRPERRWGLHVYYKDLDGIIAFRVLTTRLRHFNDLLVGLKNSCIIISRQKVRPASGGRTGAW